MALLRPLAPPVDAGISHDLARRNAAAIIVGSLATREQFARAYGDKLVSIPENGIDPGRFPQRRTRVASLPIRGVFLGRFVPYKGADMLLEAATPFLKDGRLKLDLIGDGPQMPQLRQFVAREGLEAGVTFHGWVEHSQVANRLVESDLLTFPSIREFGGGVVLEAMAVGLVPVVVNYGGPGELATEETGYRIPMGHRAQIVERLREVLARIVADPSEIDIKSQAAVRRVERNFTWAAKAQQILEVYRWVLGRRPNKPDFPELRSDAADLAAVTS